MRTNMQPTSLTAYRGVKNGLSDRRQRMLAVIAERGPITDLELSKHLAWPINVIPALRGGLRKAGLIYNSSTVKGPSGYPAMTWEATPEPAA